MKICSKCKTVVEGDICHVCQRKKFVSDANDDDIVILTTTDYISSFLVEDILNDADIKFIKKGALGGAITLYVGELTESYNFYVMAKDYNAAIDLIPDFDSAVQIDENEV